LEIDNVTMSGIDTATYQCDFKKESQKWDMLISPNPYSSGIFRRAFQFDKTLVETGYPRNDVLTNGNTPATIAALKRKFGLPSHKKVILYAPTWRDDQYYATGRYSFDLQLDITHCYQQLGEEYIIILRTHYLISRQLDVGQFDGFVFDFSNKGDIQELYLVADVLVTDYSSTYFDYAVLNRPMLFFAYDLPQYEKQIRSFYVEYEQDVPGPIVTTTAQLIEQIQHLKVEEWDATRKAFRNRYCNWDDGQAAARCVAELLNPKNKTRG
jgi:CDP-glycerol glycerophosphotransferase